MFKQRGCPRLTREIAGRLRGSLNVCGGVWGCVQEQPRRAPCLWARAPHGAGYGPTSSQNCFLPPTSSTPKPPGPRSTRLRGLAPRCGNPEEVCHHLLHTWEHPHSQMPIPEGHAGLPSPCTNWARTHVHPELHALRSPRV